jgi:ParB-like chromosome segregation protein Spo0J
MATAIEEKLPYKPIENYGTRSMIRELIGDGKAKTGRDTYYLPLNKIKVNPNYNGRITSLDTGIDELVEDLAANGLETPLLVDFDSKGNAWIDKGHRRHKALTILSEQKRLKGINKAGIQNGLVECFVNLKKQEPIDKLVSQFRDNNRGVPFNDQEVAQLCLRLHESPFNLKPEKIAEKLCISRGSVNNFLLLAGCSQDTFDAINDGVTNTTAVVTAMRILKSPDEVDEEIAKKRKDNKKFTVGDANLLKKQEAEAKDEMNPELGFGETEEMSREADSAFENAEEYEQVDNQSTFIGPESGPSVAPAAKVVTPGKKKDDIKFDKTREEIVWCNNIITNMDKIASIVGNTDLPEGTVRDVQRLIDFNHVDMEKLREWVHKNARS